MEGKKQRKMMVLWLIVVICCGKKGSGYEVEGKIRYKSVIGDPGMRRDGLRIAIESWNQCNEVGEERPNFGSPRVADCFDLHGTTKIRGKTYYKIDHKVTEEDNKLGLGDPIPGIDPTSIANVDHYAAQKELYLGSKCQIQDKSKHWNFWMIMLKNGNMDTFASLCPKNGVRVGPFGPDPEFDCFGKGCMSHPSIHHDYTALVGDSATLRGRFFGSWELGVGVSGSEISFYDVTWEKMIGKGSWIFHYCLRTSKKYPWLMLYLRSDVTHGFSGGYHYETRGMIKSVLKSPKFKVRFTLNITKGGGPRTQFYLMDMGSCWKNNGKPCNGDVTSDVTRYSEMIINPNVQSWCNPNRLGLCPPYHTFSNGTKVHRNDTKNYPYDAYHMYCGPGNGLYVEKPINKCDPFSNPQPQEIVQILPHQVWSDYGYPTKKGQGWIGDPRTWDLDVGRLSQSLYFYQDPGTREIKRHWSSINLGVEIYRDPNQVVEWSVSDFNIVVP